MTPTPGAPKPPPKQVNAGAVVAIAVAALIVFVQISSKSKESSASAPTAQEVAEQQRRDAERAATRAAELKDGQEAADKFMALAKTLDPSGRTITAAAVADDAPTTLRVMVGPAFESMPKHERLDGVTVYAKAWRSENKHCPNGCTVVLVNRVGRQVGKWGALFGAEVEE